MTADTSLPLHGCCECGACSFEVHTSPKARFRCHCLICQAFNGKPFADVVAVRAKDVVLKTPETFIQEIPSATELQPWDLRDLPQADRVGCRLRAVQGHAHPGQQF